MNKKFRNILIIVVAALVIGSCIFMFKISPISKTEKVEEIGNMEMIAANTTTDELTRDIVVEQKFINKTENIKEIAVVFTRIYYLEETDANTNVVIELCEGSKSLCKQQVLANDIPDQHRVYIYPETVLSGLVGKELTLKIYMNEDCDSGVSIMANDEVNSTYKFGKKKMSGSICFSITGE